ncbi:MAG: A1 family peptidase [Myxococcaceae bacterium]|nr:A1 family peptidase [Myxococcaceae bacterium]MBH2006819.1 A1 family peptidase [Myxococcaceae bacterium]
MKKITWLPLSILLATCTSKNTVAPTCDTQGTALSHHYDSGKAATASGVEYHISLQVDQTPVTAIADTGSANLILQSGTLQPSGSPLGKFQISYGSGTDYLTAYQGSVSLDCLAAGVPNFQYGLVQDGSMNNVSILGLAFRNKIESVPDNEALYATFMTQLAQDNSGISNEFSLQLCGYNNPNSTIYFGGLPTASSALRFEYTPIKEQSWYVIGANQIGLSGSDGGIVSSFGDLSTYGASVILDSGTTLNLLPSDIVNQIVSYLAQNYPNAATWPQIKNQLSKPVPIDCPSASELEKLPNISIALENVTLSISPQTYFKKITEGQCFFGFSIANAVDPNNPIILGQVTMENYLIRFIRTAGDNGPLGAIGFASNAGCNP